MLWLKRIQHFNEFLECDLSGNILKYGDFYYEDDEDGLIVGANYYHELEEKHIEDTFDYSKLNAAESERDYQKMLEQAEREFNTQTLFDRKIGGRNIK